MKLLKLLFLMFSVSIVMFSCKNQNNQKEENGMSKDSTAQESEMYAEVELTADISYLSANEKEMLKLMFQAGKIMDDIYWMENYGDKETFLNGITDEKLKKMAQINYGPWDNFNNDSIIIPGATAKPEGANFYPPDMTKEEFEALKDKNKTSLYTMIVRDEKGKLKVVWYHEFFAEQIKQAADLVNKAAALAEDKGLKKYLELRAVALLTDKYQASDLAWMDMKTSKIDFVVGPIENYTDGLYGYKAAHESFILLKDTVWSKKLAYYTQFLPKMQQEMPVDPKYKKEKPGNDVDLNAYDVLFYGGDCNAGGKTIAINLPNDEEVQLKKGTRKLQLKNAMKAKFDKIVMPISNTLIAADQRKYVTFDAFFANVMFHEVAHGLGIKKVLGSKQTVRDALKNTYSTIEEGKADILGLYIITKLHEMGEMKDQDLMTNYVTFMASMIRSIRFGAGEAHGKANMICFNYFMEKEAFKRNDDGTYSINFEKMQAAANSLTNDILVLQGNGDFAAAEKWIKEMVVVKGDLVQDLKRLESANIPKDIVFKQGADVLGL